MSGVLACVSHPDDDLLFCNPAIAQAIRDGEDVTVLYMTAGEVPYRAGKAYGGIGYADQRIAGARAAYASMAGLPSAWTYEAISYSGRELATNTLDGDRVRLIYTYVHAAAGPEDNQGDLYRMWARPDFVARPIDQRPGFTRAAFLQLLRGVIEAVDPDVVFTMSTVGHREGDHVDHTASALLVAEATVDARGRSTIVRQEFSGYVIANWADNVASADRDAKKAAWDAYRVYDPEVPAGAWQNIMARQYPLPGRRWERGAPWTAPGDFVVFP